MADDEPADSVSWVMEDHERFLAVLTARNRGLISEQEQATLRHARILIAGCGGIGGAAIEPLVRAGAESIVLADDGVFALEDMGRESMRVQDAGRNKASVFAERMAELNPFARITPHVCGLTSENLTMLVADADLIIDGIGTVEPAGLRTKLSLHQQARDQRKPVVSGYDVAGTLWAPIYDYRNAEVRLFDGKVSDAESTEISSVEFLSRMFGSLKMPIEMLPEFERQMMGQSIAPPALGSTTLMFGALAVRLVIDILEGRPVRSSVQIDIPSQVRPRRERLKVAGKRLAMLYAANNRLRDLRKSGRLGVYSPLDDAVFADMREYMEERVWEAGSVIVRQGEAGRDFYVIADGEVQIELEHDDPEIEPDVIAKLGPGEYFGELSLLTDEPRNASVVAATRCRVLSLSRDAFETYLDESATARRRVAEVSMTRVRRNR